MGRRKTPFSTRLASSLTVRDEDFQLWQYRVVGEIGTNRKNGRKPARRKPRHTRRKAVEKPESSPPSATDDVYYLRWNLTGDYDSDDEDWWNEVMALEREAHNNDKKKEKLAAKEAAKERSAKEEALYRRYKDHTRNVMEWGNSTWVDRYNGPDNESDVGIAHLSLRTLVGRLNDLAHDGIGMPSSIYRNLEQAIELREEFQDRIILERLNQREGKEIRKSRRRKKTVDNPKTSLSSSSNSSEVETGAGNCVDDRKILEDTPASTKQNTTKTNKISGMNKHRWILYQLKVLSNRFRIEPDLSIKLTNESSDDDDCGIVLWDSENNCGESNNETRTEHFVTDKCRFDNNDKGRIGDKKCVESPSRLIVGEDDVATATQSSCSMSSCSASFSSSAGDDKRCSGRCSTSDFSTDDWDEIFGDDGSLIENNENHDPCLQTPEILLSYQKDESQSVSTEEMSSPSCKSEKKHTDDWDDIFGDDGSRIENHENHDPCLQTPEVVLPLIPCYLQVESQSLSTQEISKSDLNSKNKNVDSYPKLEMEQKGKSIDNNTLSSKVFEQSNTSNNSVGRYSPRNINGTPIEESKSKSKLSDPTPIVTPEKLSTSKECTLPVTIRSNVEQFRQTIHCSSVSDISFEKKKRPLSNSKSIPVKLDQKKTQAGMASSQQNLSATPEKSSALNDFSITAKDESGPEPAREAKQYGSVWDISFQEENETSMHLYTDGTPVLTEEISLQNSNPPEDWETLLDEEEEEEEEEKDILEAGKLVEETRRLVICEAEARKKTSHDTLPSEIGDRNVDFSQREKTSVEKAEPAKVFGQRTPVRETAKLEKPPHVTTEKLGYDSVWDIFIKENSSNSVQVEDNHATPRPIISMVEKPEPEDDWEALYT